MKRIFFYFAKLRSIVFHNHEVLVDYYRRKGAHIGRQCLICTPLLGVDSWLISIGNRSVVSTNVEFVLHDYSISRVIPDKSNLFGKIVVGNNCFIGTRSVIMYGVELADNIIVAAGSVVVNSFFESNIIIEEILLAKLEHGTN